MAINYQKDEGGIVVLTLDMPDRKANLLGSKLAEAFAAAVGRLAGEEGLAGVILRSAKKDFLAGADIDEMLAWTDAKAVFETTQRFKAAMRRFETLGKPCVAAIHGAALGGGYELALCCHRRVAVDDPRARIGLPETTLGLFPGGGGTQRLPRMIGLQNALPIILEGKTMPPRRALEAGLVDELAASPEDALAKAKTWILANPDARQPWDQRGFKWPGGPSVTPKNAPMWALAPSMLNMKTRGHYPAQRHALAAVFEGGCVDFDTACRIESRYFAKTAVSREAKNMIALFWTQLNRVNKGGSRPTGLPQWPVEKIGVLGAGMMGAGIAYAAACAGLQVILMDVDLTAAERGKAHSERLLSKRLARGAVDKRQKQDILDKIKTTEAADDLAGCQLVIEAVFEDRDLKARVVGEAETRLSDDAIFASNTSTLPISGLAEASARPANFIGLHFFSPVDKMKLVEIIVGAATSNKTLSKAFDFVLKIKKTPIVVNDSRGFYTSRVFRCYVLEGAALVREGQAPATIEAAGLEAGMPVGPLALMDEVSLSLMRQIMAQTQRDQAAELAGGKAATIAAHPADEVIVRMADALKRPGKKVGAGFYDYPANGEKRLWPGLRAQWPAAAVLPRAELTDRLMFAQALETVRCLDEGVVTSVADANVGSVFGWGFAPFKGGTLQYINDRGLPGFVARADELAAAYGQRFEPPSSLRAMAARGEAY